MKPVLLVALASIIFAAGCSPQVKISTIPDTITEVAPPRSYIGQKTDIVLSGEKRYTPLYVFKNPSRICIGSEYGSALKCINGVTVIFETDNERVYTGLNGRYEETKSNGWIWWVDYELCR